MSIFAISDLHLATKNPQKSMEIFTGWEDYHERLRKNWNTLVTQDDTVVIVGDISWGLKLDEALPDLQWINKLNGKKLLLKGNHDLWWTTKKKLVDALETVGCDTIDFIYNSAVEVEGVAICGSRGWLYNSQTEHEQKIVKREAGRIERSILEAEEKGFTPIVFIHYPPVYGDIECSEIIDVLLKHKIKECYYGHIHGGNAVNNAILGDYKGVNFKLVSADYLKFMPKLVRLENKN